MANISATLVCQINNQTTNGPSGYHRLGCSCQTRLERERLTEKGDVTGRVADEFDEGLLRELAQPRMWRDDVGDGEQRKEQPDAKQLQRLVDDVSPPKAGY